MSVFFFALHLLALCNNVTLLHEYASCDGQLCMSLEAKEVAGVYGTLPAALKFFVLDCRFLINISDTPHQRLLRVNIKIFIMKVF